MQVELPRHVGVYRMEIQFFKPQGIRVHTQRRMRPAVYPHTQSLKLLPYPDEQTVRREIGLLRSEQNRVYDEALEAECHNHDDEYRCHAPHKMRTQSIDMLKKSHFGRLLLLPFTHVSNPKNVLGTFPFPTPWIRNLSVWAPKACCFRHCNPY